MLFEDIWKCLVLTVTTVIRLVANGTLIPILASSKDIQEDSASPLLLALSGSDFLQAASFGVISCALGWSDATNDNVPNSLAMFHTFSLLHTRLANLHLISAIAVVKMITIVKPLRASTILTKKRIWIIVIICCTVPFAVSLGSFIVPVVYSHKFKDSYFLNRGVLAELLTAQIFASFIIFTLCYAVIIICVVKQVINMRRLVIPAGEAATGTQSANPILVAFKSARAIIALCTVSLICISLANSLTRLNIRSTANARFVIYRLYDCNGFINVFVYIAFCKPAKRVLKNFFAHVQLLCGCDNNSAQEQHDFAT